MAVWTEELMDMRPMPQEIDAQAHELLDAATNEVRDERRSMRRPLHGYRLEAALRAISRLLERDAGKPADTEA